ncbi:MAG: hypothetical protein R3C59_23325 [Planctomycetaceae bacterium]
MYWPESRARTNESIISIDHHAGVAVRKAGRINHQKGALTIDHSPALFANHTQPHHQPNVHRNRDTMTPANRRSDIPRFPEHGYAVSAGKDQFGLIMRLAAPRRLKLKTATATFRILIFLIVTS